MFKKELATQIVAYFAWKEGGKISCPKVMKLAYFAERNYLLKYCSRLIGDDMFSVKHGPILSQTSNLINFGDVDPNSPWSKWISNLADKYLGLRKEISTVDDFDLFSRASLSVLDSVYDEFGSYSAEELSAKSHEKECCPEWQNPGDSSIYIPIDDLLTCHGKSSEETSQIMNFLEEAESYQYLVSRLV